MALTLGRKMGLLGGGRSVCRSPPESLAFTWRPHCVRDRSWVHPRAAPQGDDWSPVRDAPTPLASVPFAPPALPFAHGARVLSGALTASPLSGAGRGEGAPSVS